MKKILFVLTIILALNIAEVKSQVFHSGKVLKSGRVSLGINPAYFSAVKDFGVAFHGGYGLGDGYDLGIKTLFGYGDPYIEGNFEIALLRRAPFLSLTLGAHVQNDFGLNANFNTDITLGRSADLYLGIDMQVNFYKAKVWKNGEWEEETKTYVPVWLFVGAEWFLRRDITFLGEILFPVNDNDDTILSFGVNFYFN
jgi:hypothetical protein